VILLGLGLLLVTPPSSQSATREAKIRFVEPWSNVFSGQKATFHAVVTGVPTDGARIGWRLVAGSSTVARGEVSVHGENPTPITLDIPPSKPGVVSPWILQVSAIGTDPETSVERHLWAFPENPFEGRETRFADQHISLFDPKGDTAVILKEFGVPFSALRRSDDVAVADGLVMIGEGVSFQDQRGLADAMIETATRGTVVLCLAPADGEFVLPGTDTRGATKPTALNFRQTDIISELDKRLDTATWASGVPAVVSSIELQSYRQSVSALVSSGPAGWPWVDIGYGNQGRLMVCGFGIIQHWESNPTARWLLTALLEKMADKGSTKEQGDDSNE